MPLNWMAGVDFIGIRRNSGTKIKASIKSIHFTVLQELLLIFLTQPKYDPNSLI